jgi:hypothetical protein
MALLNDKPRVIEALRAALPGVRVTETWPKAQERLPCVVIMESSNVHAVEADNRAYADELTIDAHVFSVSVAEKQSAASMVDDVFGGLRYKRILVYDQDEFSTKHKVMRYRTLLPV